METLRTEKALHDLLFIGWGRLITRFQPPARVPQHKPTKGQEEFHFSSSISQGIGFWKHCVTGVLEVFTVDALLG